MQIIQLIRVLSGCDYICLVDCYSISATTFIFLSSVVTLVYIYFIMIEL